MNDSPAVRQLGWGVLGASGYISGLLIPAIERTAGSRLTAVASRPESLAAAATRAEPYGARVHTDYASLLDDPDVDVVYIPLPNTQHLEWTIRALEAGKHVLVEKPLVLTVADGERVAAAAEKAGRQVMEAFMYRFHPQQARAAALLASGTIGDLWTVHASFAFAIPTGSGNIRLDPTLGGGATWDVGVYAVDVARLFFGRDPVSAYASFTTRTGEGVETGAAALLDFGHGRHALLDYSIDYGPRARYELQGERGTITVHNAWAMAADPGRITIRDADGEREENVTPVDHYQLQVQAFADAVTTCMAPPMSIGESIRTVATAGALCESARLGRPVPLSTAWREAE